MTTNPNRQEFIARSRRLAAAFIQASDTFAALAAELTYTDLELPPEEGGLSIEDFVGMNIDLTPGQLLSFYATMAALLAPLTVEQKKTIYAVKGGTQNVLMPGV